MQKLDTRSFKRSITSLAEYPMLVMSFSLYKGLTSLFFFLTPELPEAIPVFAGAATSVTITCLIISVTCVLFAAFGRNIELLQNPHYLYLMAVALIVGITLLVVVVPYLSLPAAKCALYILAMTLTAFGACAIHIEFGRLMGYLGATYTLIFNVACSLFGLPITFLLLQAPLVLRFALSSAAIILTVETFLRSANGIGRKRIYEVPETELTIPWRFLITSFAQGIAVGFCITIFSGSRISSIFAGHALPVLGAAIASYFFGLAARIDFDRLIYHIGFAAIGFSCLMTALAGGNVAVQTVASLLLLSAYIFLDIILWSLGSHLIKNCQQPAIWVAACPSASLMAGRFIGSCIGSDQSLLLLPTPFNHGTTLAIVASFGFTALALYLSSGNNLKNGWGFIVPNGAESPTDREWACELIAEDFKLTGREKDVLMLLSTGKTRAEIAEQLVVTPNTVKTHIRNLYTKLGVHSNDELMKMIAHQQHAFESH